MVGSPGHQLADRDHQQWSPHNAQVCAAGAERGIDAATAPNGGYLRAGADWHWLRSVTQFLGRRRADCRLGVRDVPAKRV